jgi:hypothetical protein
LRRFLPPLLLSFTPAATPGILLGK